MHGGLAARGLVLSLIGGVPWLCSKLVLWGWCLLTGPGFSLGHMIISGIGE